MPTTCCGYNAPHHASDCKAVRYVLTCLAHLPADAVNVRSTDDARSKPCTTCGNHATMIYSTEA